MGGDHDGAGLLVMEQMDRDTTGTIMKEEKKVMEKSEVAATHVAGP